MGNVWFTSDLHLGHERIVELSHRPFDSIHQHDAAIFDRWTAKVRDGDLVYVLGDLSVEGSYKHALGMMAELPGRKRLITGNHDRAWVGKSDAFRFMPEYLKVFEAVTPWARAKVDGVKVLLSHFPYSGDHTESDRYDEYRLRPSKTTLLHGHTHVRFKAPLCDLVAGNAGAAAPWWTGPQITVGVDAWNFTPVSQQQITALLSGEQAAA